MDYSKLFIDPNISTPMPHSAFADYIEQCKIHIKNTRLDLATNPDKIINANAPYELHPSTATHNKLFQYGALLIHGLLDSPFTMRDIGANLQAEGMLVRAVLLPGHGTVPGALLHVHYQQWIETVRLAVESLAKEVEQIFLVGFSTGGALALYQAIQHPANMAGIILIAPALKINSSIDFLSPWATRLGKHVPSAAWFHRDKQETTDYTKYLSTPFNAISQVYSLGKEVKKYPAPTCPLLIALAKQDLTVRSQVSMDYFMTTTNPHSRLIVYSSTMQDTYQDNRIVQRTSHYPAMRIHDFSHITLPIAINNPHYGIQGDYPDGSHIAQDTQTQYGEPRFLPFDFHNVLFKYKLVRDRYQRLTFNPDFEFMSGQIKKFIQNQNTPT